MLYEMKEKYKKIYGMQAAVVLNLMHKGKDLLAFNEVNISEIFRLAMC